MTAPVVFPIPEGIAIHISWCPRERRAVSRESRDYDLLRAIAGRGPAGSPNAAHLEAGTRFANRVPSGEAGRMKAGRGWDALISEKVMGYSIHRFKCPHPPAVFCSCPVMPRYSTDIAAAWEVVRKLRADGYWLLLSEGEPSIGSRWYGLQDSTFLVRMVSAADSGTAESDTAPLAICLAALAAVGAEVPA